MNQMGTRGLLQSASEVNHVELTIIRASNGIHAVYSMNITDPTPHDMDFIKTIAEVVEGFNQKEADRA